MTKQSAAVFLNYIKELAREAGVPYKADYGKFEIVVIVHDGSIFEINIDGSAKIRPQK